MYHFLTFKPSVQGLTRLALFTWKMVARKPINLINVSFNSNSSVTNFGRNFDWMYDNMRHISKRYLRRVKNFSKRSFSWTKLAGRVQYYKTFLPLSIHLPCFYQHSYHRCSQCDQIGWFLKVIGDKFSYKVAQLYEKRFGLFWNHSFSRKTAVFIFWKIFGKFGLLCIWHLVSLDAVYCTSTLLNRFYREHSLTL